MSRWLRDIELTPDQQLRIHRQNLAIRKKVVDALSKSQRDDRKKYQVLFEPSSRIGKSTWYFLPLDRRFSTEQVVEYSSRKRAAALAEKEGILTDATREVGPLSERELRLIGAAPSWAEGSKAGLVEFVNSDPLMVALMRRRFRECGAVPESKFRARGQVHDSSRLAVIQAFWSQLTGIPFQQFTRPARARRGETRSPAG